MSHHSASEGTLSLHFDRTRMRLTIEAKGSWNLKTVASWRSAIDYFLSEERANIGCLQLMVDLRECQILSKEAADEIQAYNERIASCFQRTALVAPESALFRIQMRRITPLNGHEFLEPRHFSTGAIEVARKWLDEALPR